MLGLVGRKIGMTQGFDEKDHLVALTVLQAGPCPIIQVKDEASDGYSAVRVGFEEVPPHRLTRPELGTFKKAGTPPLRVLREFRVDDTADHSVGDILDVGIFDPGERVDVTGRTKGKGFQGGVKRHGFKGGPKTHGQSDRHRAPGSIGQSSDPSRVFKGVKMAGHMGDRRATTKGLTVVQVDKERNLLLVKGAVPGAHGGLVVIRKRRDSE